MRTRLLHPAAPAPAPTLVDAPAPSPLLSSDGSFSCASAHILALHCTAALRKGLVMDMRRFLIPFVTDSLNLLRWSNLLPVVKKKTMKNVF
jgi:hypothetical protein